MKKCIVLIVLAMSVTFACASEVTKFSKNFIRHFEDCETYEETTTSEFEGKSFTSQKRIVGWRNHFCQYIETLKSTDGTYEISCNLTSAQVDDLYEAMKNKSSEPEKFELEIFDAITDEKGIKKYVSVGSRTIKGNKAFVTWAKYQNNPYFCTYTKLN